MSPTSTSFNDAKKAEAMARGNLVIPEKEKLSEEGVELLVAARQGNYRKIAKMVRMETDVNVAEPDEGYTALMYGATYNDASVIAALIRSPELNLNAQNRFGATALIVAVTVGATAAVQALVGEPAILLNVKAYNGLSAFGAAMKKGDPEILQILLRDKRYVMSRADRYRLGW